MYRYENKQGHYFKVILDNVLLSTIRKKLVAVENYGEARKIIEQAGLTNADDVLVYLRYKVKWKGLDFNEERIGLQ